MQSWWIPYVELFGAIVTVVQAIIFFGKLFRSFSRPSQVKPTERSRKDYGIGVTYSFICAVLWSLSYVSLSYISPRAPSLAVNIVLLGSASVFLTIAWLIAEYSYGRRDKAPPTYISWKALAPWTVVVTNLASFLLFIYALHFISASQTITLQKTNPLFILLFAVLWLKQKPPKSSLSAVVLVVFGTVLLLANDEFKFEDSANLTGSAVALLAGVAFALFSVGLDKVGEGATSLVRGSAFMAIVFLLSYTGLVTIGYFGEGYPQFDTQTMGILILNGLRIALVYALYNAAIHRIGALLASVIVALEVPLTMIWDWGLLHRVLGLRLFLGAGAILFGAITLVWDRSPWSNSGAAETTEP